MNGPEGPFCQSCGMPLSRDDKGGGTETDGAMSTDYCSHCYQRGKFTEPNLTAEQMVARVQGMMKQMGVPDAVASALSKDVPKLKRWRS